MSIKKLITNNKDLFYYKVLEKHLTGCLSVLDVGCGDNSPLKKVKKTFWSSGIDAFEPSLVKSQKKRIHDRYTLGDINKLCQYFKPKSFDAVIALDIIEHFEKENAVKIIAEMEKIARKKVIILTPNGFYAQDDSDSNPYQRHKSEWSKEELSKLGYRVYGLRGLKYLRGEYATIRYKPWLFWGSVAFFSEPLLYYLPDLSYDLLAVKIL